MAFKTVDDGEDERAPDMDSKPDNLPEGYYSKYHPLVMEI